MNAFRKLLNLNHWSIWIKLMLAFSLAILIPATIGFVVISQQVNSVDQENLERYVTERGVQLRQQVASVFDRASGELDAFVGDEARGRGLNLLIAFENRQDRILDNLIDYLDTELLASGLFDSAQVVDWSGEVLLSSGSETLAGRLDHVPVGTDLSDSSAHQVAQTAGLLGDDQRLVLSGELNPQIALVHVLYRRDEPIGYVLGDLNYDGTIVSLLHDNSAFIETRSYLATEAGQLVTWAGNVAEVQATLDEAPVKAGLISNGTTVYQAGDQEFVAYHTSITSTPFALITETRADFSFSAGLNTIVRETVLLFFLLMISAAGLTLVTNAGISPALASLRNTVRAMGEGNFRTPITGLDRGDEIGALARAIDVTRDQVEHSLEELRTSMEARVRDLQATQQISRFVSTRRDLQDLMNEVVNLIVDLFPNIYHAQVFLLDRDKEYALLQASTGEPGRQLLERGHRLAVGSISVIGQVTENGKIELARDTGASDVHRPNEFLPETRSELAIPLYVGEEVIGALDVQSRQRNTFTEDQINILEAMAGQVAVAIRNAQLYSESLRRLEELTAFNREATLNAWRTYMRDSRQQVLVKEAGVRLDEPYDSLRDEAVAKGEPVIGEISERDTIPFALPIVLRDQLLGAVELELPESAFTMEKVRLAQELVNRLALTLDNARLFQESQRATNRERLVNEIAAKLTNQTDLDEILQTAVREVGQALRVPVVDIEMRMSPSMQRSTPPTSNGHPTDSPVKNGKHS